MYSGLETSTLTLYIAISARSESLNAWRACFEAANDERNGIGTLPATLLTNTIFPDLRWIIDGSKAVNEKYVNNRSVFLSSTLLFLALIATSMGKVERERTKKHTITQIMKNKFYELFSGNFSFHASVPNTFVKRVKACACKTSLTNGTVIVSFKKVMCVRVYTIFT